MSTSVRPAWSARRLVVGLLVLGLAFGTLAAPGPSAQAQPVGGVEPEVQYPFICRTFQNGLGQPAIDNQDGQGVPVLFPQYENQLVGGYPPPDVYANLEEHGEDERVAGFSRDCEAVAPVVEYWYATTAPIFENAQTVRLNELPESVEDLPGNVRMTEIIEPDGEGGVTTREVPYVMRVVKDTKNRFISSIAMLIDIEAEDPATDQSLWNGRLTYSFSGGVGFGFAQGNWNRNNALYHNGISRGYAVVWSSGTSTAHHYNLLRGGQTANAVKAWFVEEHGEPDYTIGVGGSGGGIQQFMYAQNEPGLLDAGVAQYAYPDMATQTIHIGDCELLEHYMERTGWQAFLDAEEGRRDDLEAARQAYRWADVTERPKLVGLNAEQAPANKGGSAKLQWNALYGFAAHPDVPGGAAVLPLGYGGDVTQPSNFTQWLLQVALPIIGAAEGGNEADLPDVPMTECRPGWFGLTAAAMNPLFNVVDNFDKVLGYPDPEFTHWRDSQEVYGIDEATGLTRVPWDNMGVQYGLRSFVDGELELDEFLHANGFVGGWTDQEEMVQDGAPFNLLFSGLDLSDIDVADLPDVIADYDQWSSRNMRLSPDGVAPAQRRLGDLSAIENAYRNGHVFLGELDIPIIDWRHYLEHELDMHNTIQSFAVRERLLDRQGNADNVPIWFTDGRPEPAFDQTWDGFALLHEWIENRRDHPELSLGETRPGAPGMDPVTTLNGDVISGEDACFDTEGDLIYQGPDAWDGIIDDQPEGPCTQGFEIKSTSRVEAGGPIRGDVFKCETMPVRTAVAEGLYGERTGELTEEHVARLEAVFPTGVCDYELRDLGDPDRTDPVAVAVEAGPEALEVSGASPFATIQLRQGGEVVARVDADSFGSVTASGLDAGETYVVAQERDGRRGALSAPVTVLEGDDPGEPVTGPFPDVPADHVHVAAIRELVERGAISGFADGTFRPALDVTRAQFASILGQALELDPVASGPFPDVEGSTHAGWVNALEAAGYLGGFDDGTFGPNRSISRGQVATILGQLLDVEPLDEGPLTDVSGVHAGYIHALTALGVISGYPDGTFGQRDPISRAQTATLIVQALRELPGAD